MDTIQQIREKLYEMQAKSNMIRRYQIEILNLQSDIETLSKDLKYDQQVEQFMQKRD